MGSRLTARAGAALVAGLIAAAAVALAAASSHAAPGIVDSFPRVMVVVLAASLACVVYWTDPAYTFCAAIVLSPISSNWQQVGVPGAVAPDRLLLIGAIVAVALRFPGARDRPPLQLRAVHWLLGLAVVYAGASAVIAGSLTERPAFFKLLETFGVLPFLAFLFAPTVFRTARQRSALLVSLVVLGGYLSVTVLFETIKFDALVFPKYIVDPNYGIHFDRGRGIFGEATTNGFGLYTCAVAAIIAFRQWRSTPARGAALAVVVGGVVGAFLTLERSVWVATVAATVITMMVVPGLFRFLVPAVLAGAIAVAASLALIPGLSARVHERTADNQSVWDRKNLQRAGVNMVSVRPLTGFGWARFNARSTDYFQQSPDYPLTATGSTAIHNVFLSNAVDLGLPGLTIWVAGLIAGVATALAARGPPDLRSWRSGLVAVAIFYAVIGSFVPSLVFPNLALWLWAGICCTGYYPTVVSTSVLVER